VEELFVSLVTNLVSGGPQSIIAGLVLFIVLLLFERKRLMATITKKDEDLLKKDDKIDKIIEDYYKGNMTLADALNGLKVVLFDIKSRL
jgi:hypothetical protein